MTTCDELTDLIMDVFDAHDEGHLSTAQDAAQRILARWRLVPVEEHEAKQLAEALEWVDQLDPATLKARTDLRTERIKLHYEGFSDRQIAERQGMSTRTIAAWRRKSGLKYNDGKQHRAADELTQHDQASGIYESNGIVYCGECNERISRGHATGCHSK